MNVKVNLWWSENMKRWRWTLCYDLGADREMYGDSHHHLKEATNAIYTRVDKIHQQNTSILL